MLLELQQHVFEFQLLQFPSKMFHFPSDYVNSRQKRQTGCCGLIVSLLIPVCSFKLKTVLAHWEHLHPYGPTEGTVENSYCIVSSCFIEDEIILPAGLPYTFHSLSRLGLRLLPLPAACFAILTLQRRFWSFALLAAVQKVVKLIELRWVRKTAQEASSKPSIEAAEDLNDQPFKHSPRYTKVHRAMTLFSMLCTVIVLAEGFKGLCLCIFLYNWNWMLLLHV